MKGAGRPACDPRLTDSFAPPARLGRYEVCVSPDGLDASRIDGFTYGEIEHLEALDAFGDFGRLDRSKLAQLYGGRRVGVLRGWRRTGDTFESHTLLSPYPDPALTRLDPGTMTIRWTWSPAAR